MKTSHTPSHWLVEDYGRPEYLDGAQMQYKVHTGDPKKHVVCYCGGAKDARLIAAAPDLLAALKYMVRAQAQPWDHADRRASKDAALAAIRKATE